MILTNELNQRVNETVWKIWRNGNEELLEDFIDDVRYGLYIESLEYDENGEPMTREKVVKKMIARFSYKR